MEATVVSKEAKEVVALVVAEVAEAAKLEPMPLPVLLLPLQPNLAASKLTTLQKTHSLQ